MFADNPSCLEITDDRYSPLLNIRRGLSSQRTFYNFGNLYTYLFTSHPDVTKPNLAFSKTAAPQHSTLTMNHPQHKGRARGLIEARTQTNTNVEDNRHAIVGIHVQYTVIQYSNMTSDNHLICIKEEAICRQEHTPTNFL